MDGETVKLGDVEITVGDIEGVARLHAEGKTPCEIVRILYLPTRHVRYIISAIEAAKVELAFDEAAAEAEMKP